MKRFVLSIVCCLFIISVNASPLPKSKAPILSVKESINAKSFSFRCFDLTVYTLCGYVWQGDVCVNTELNWLTDSQIWTAIHFTDLRLCGYTDEEVEVVN